ncbi:MAG: DUF11 domain-containing protein, partial [Nitrosopumilaceae archaeon]
METRVLLVFVILLSSIFTIPGFSQTALAAPEDKISICHLPPGNPENIQTITVGQISLQAHLDHGDDLGTCEVLADLSITKQGPSAVIVDTNFNYTITVSNAGPQNATNVVVTDVLPDGINYVSDSDSCEEGPDGTLTCSLDDIENGDSKSFDITVNANQTGSITNVASVDSDTDDQDESNNTSDGVDTNVLDEGADLADLSITKQGPSAVIVDT